MSETQTTAPGPWKLDEYEPWTVNDAEGDQVATCWGDESNKADAANAAHIVKCVNAHDELVKALEPFAAVAEHDIGEDETDDDRFQPIQSDYNRAPKLTVGDLRRALAVLSSLKAGG